MIVANSSPVIILGKRGMLKLLNKCFKKVIISDSVYNEVIQKEGSPEAVDLKKAVKDKWIVVEKVATNPILVTKKLGQGEKDAISIAAKHKSQLLIDDDSAKTYASILNVEAHGSLHVIYLACIKNIISKAKARDILDNMIIDGFYISTELYSKFLSLLNSLK